MSYLANAGLMGAYHQAQRKYAGDMRESDKVMLRLIQLANPQSLLDIGCSTGNLLAHIRRACPAIDLTGGDLSPAAIELARARSELAGVALRNMDMLAIDGRYDCITANVVTFGLDWPRYDLALGSVARALNPGGSYIAFDFVHLHQDLAVTETTPLSPEGVTLYLRNQARVAAILRKHGLMLTRVWPFTMPFDLPMPAAPADLTSHTRTLADGARLCFRGVLYQPWCHLVAVKGNLIG